MQEMDLASSLQGDYSFIPSLPPSLRSMWRPCLLARPGASQQCWDTAASSPAGKRRALHPRSQQVSYAVHEGPSREAWG